MIPWTHPLALLVLAPPALVVLGYRLATGKARQRVRDIRAQARARGWAVGRPLGRGGSALSLQGRTRQGLPWILDADSTGPHAPGGSNSLVFRIAGLGGETDLILGLAAGDPAKELRALPGQVPGLVTRLSGIASSALEFLRTAQAHPVPPDGTLYLVPGRSPESVLTPELARSIRDLAPALRAHFMAWRIPGEFQVRARLGAPPLWAELLAFIQVAEGLSEQAGGGVPALRPPTLLDRLVARF